MQKRAFKVGIEPCHTCDNKQRCAVNQLACVAYREYASLNITIPPQEPTKKMYNWIFNDG